MWQVDEQDWQRLQRVAGLDCPTEVQLKLKKLIDKGCISSADVNQIYELLPDEAPFYEFAQQLRIKPRRFDNASKQTPEFVALTQRLRREQETKEYNRMVSSVDSTQNYGHVNYMQDFGKEMKEVNKQILAIVNTLITVAGAFAFGFYGISFAYPSLKLTFETQIVLGLCSATVVFLADLYFIAKSMDPPTSRAKTRKNEKYICAESDSESVMSNPTDGEQGITASKAEAVEEESMSSRVTRSKRQSGVMNQKETKLKDESKLEVDKKSKAVLKQVKTETKKRSKAKKSTSKDDDKDDRTSTQEQHSEAEKSKTIVENLTTDATPAESSNTSRSQPSSIPRRRRVTKID